MQNKLMSVSEAVSLYTRDGMQYAHGAGISVGCDSLAFGREMVRQGRKNLHMLTHCCTQQLNLLCAAGAVDKLETAFTGLEVYGFPQGLKRAVESGKVTVEDYSNLGFSLRLLAGAMNWPFCPTISAFGSDQEWRSGFNPEQYPCTTKIPEVTDPFTGKSCHVLSPLKPDLAAIHVTMADIHGNAIMIGTEWSRYEMSRASKSVVLQADHIVHTDCMRQFPNLVRIPDFVVDAVVYAPMGVWPACSTGLYDSDEEHFNYMNSCMKTEEGFLEYRSRFIDSYDTTEGFLEIIGKERIKGLRNTPTAHLMDPYRKWIMSDSEIAALLKDRR
jgi:glutaconate CoA-transferase subunit A